MFYYRDNCLDSIIFKLNVFIKELSQWLDFNKLTPNISKTKIMIFNSHKQMTIPEIYFNNEVLEQVHHFKYLGVFIDDRLTFKEHISFLCNRLSQVKGILYAASPYFNRKCLVLMYNSLAYSLFIQSIIVYGKSFNSLLQPLRTILNSILRIILNVKKDFNGRFYMTNNRLYRELNLLKFDDAYDYFLLKFFRNALHFNTDIFNIYFREHIPAHSYPTRSAHFNIPNFRTETERNFIVYRAIHLFNNIPENFKHTMSDFKFKKIFKEFCMNKYVD